jgi:hypothetical protein
MKNVIRFLVVIAIVAVTGFSFAACDSGGGGGGGGGGGNNNNTNTTFTSIDALEKYLEGQPYNDAGAPYTIKLKITDASQFEALRTTLNAGLKYVYIDLTGSTITTIPDNAFYKTLEPDCIRLTGITIPNGVTSIGEQAFTRCTSLTSITIPNSVTSIWWSAFSGCTGLTSVTIPNRVTSIGIYAFSDCRNLTAITVAAGNSAYTSQDGVLYNKDKTLLHTYPAGKIGVSFAIPNGVTSIGWGAFSGCTGLTSVTISYGVTTIEGGAFTNTNFTDINIPSSVTSIGSLAFIFCTNLTSVTFQGTIPSSTFDNNAFYGDLKTKFYETNSSNGTAGIYTTTSPVSASSVWTKM